jgi:hypothetical protein
VRYEHETAAPPAGPRSLGSAPVPLRRTAAPSRCLSRSRRHARPARRTRH